MNESWSARPRPMSSTLAVAILRCTNCGRGLYMSLHMRDWGNQFCCGCDEPMGACYCPDSREVTPA